MKRALWALAGACILASANADLVENFEALTGSAAGTALGGQGGWYLPPVANSGEQFVFTYAGNTLGHPALATVGGTKFAGSEMLADNFFRRGQKDHAFSGGFHTMVTYWCLDWNGTPDGETNNGGSFSMSGTGTFQQAIQGTAWEIDAVGVILPAHPSIGYSVWSDTGVLLGNFIFDFVTDLQKSHWYRVSTWCDFVTNQYLAFSLTDMDTGETGWNVLVGDGGPDPTGPDPATRWNMQGGPDNFLGLPLPTASRIFTGGGSGAGPAGNQTGWDWVRSEAGLFTICDSVAAAPGAVLVGDVRSTYENDDQRFECRPGVALTTALPPLSINMTFTTIFIQPDSITVNLEVNASTGGIQRTVEILRAGTTTWDVMPGGTAANLPTTDTVQTFTTTNNPMQYIDQTTGECQVRMRCKATGPVLVYPWRARIDRATLVPGFV